MVTILPTDPRDGVRLVIVGSAGMGVGVGVDEGGGVCCGAGVGVGVGVGSDGSSAARTRRMGFAFEIPFAFTTLMGQAGPMLHGVFGGSASESVVPSWEIISVSTTLPLTRIWFPINVKPLPEIVSGASMETDAGAIAEIFGGFLRATALASSPVFARRAEEAMGGREIS